MRQAFVWLACLGLLVGCAAQGTREQSAPTPTSTSPSPTASPTPTEPPSHTIRGRLSVRFGGEAFFLNPNLPCGMDRGEWKQLLAEAITRAKTDQEAGETRVPTKMHKRCPAGVGSAWSDLKNGAQVVVRGADNSVLAAGVLSDGYISVAARLIFNFEIPDVPDAATYQVGMQTRPGVVVMREALVDDDWTLDLDIS